MNQSEASDREPVRTFEWTTHEGPSEAAIRALSAVVAGDPATAEPLYDSVDPDALDRLFARLERPAAAIDGQVEFEYRGMLVVISTSGRGYVYELGDPGDRPDAAPPSPASREE